MRADDTSFLFAAFSTSNSVIITSSFTYSSSAENLDADRDLECDLYTAAVAVLPCDIDLLW
jgi:hypothetical protein